MRSITATLSQGGTEHSLASEQFDRPVSEKKIVVAVTKVSGVKEGPAVLHVTARDASLWPFFSGNEAVLEKNPKALKLIQTCPADNPLAVQLFGSVPEEMRDAAVYLESLGMASIDINMGCPVRKVCRVGGGSAMMTELDKTAKLVKGMVDAVKIPVTAKMRLGWDDQNLTAPDLARALEEAGVAGIFRGSGRPAHVRP